MTTAIDVSTLTPNLSTATFARHEDSCAALRADSTLVHDALRAADALAVRSNWHSDLQSAVDAAISRRVPLIIEPGARVVNEPIRVYDTSNLFVSAHRASLTANSTLPSVLDISGAAFCRFDGLHVVCNAPVERAVYIHNRDEAALVTTSNLFTSLFVQGQYDVGVRVGAPSDTSQCDMMRFIHLVLSGDEQRNPIGLYLGSDVHANNLIHSAWGVNAHGHAEHVRISGTNATVEACSFDRSSVADVVLSTAWMVSLRGIRSESGKRLIDSSATAGVAAQVSLSDAEMWAQDLHSDGGWLVFNKGGVLRLSNIKVLHAPIAGVVRAAPPASLALDISGLITDAPIQNAFDINVNVHGQCNGYVQIENGAPQSVSSVEWA